MSALGQQEGLRQSVLSSIWQPKYDLKEAEIQQQSFNLPPSHQSIQALLQRGIQHFNDEVQVKIEVKGIYALPEEWISKIDDPSEQQFQYEVKLLGASIKGGKMMPKEDPEEQQAVTDGGSIKDKKPPPPKGKNEKEVVQKVEEISPEEEERIKKEIAEREKQNAKLQEEWNNLTEDDKFYQTAENKQKEPYIIFKGDGSDVSSEPSAGNMVNFTLSTQAFAELESQVNDPSIRGCKILVEKIIAQNTEEVGKGGKAAPPKGKPPVTGNVEESKPVSGEAWLDFIPFLYPGSTETIQRCFIRTISQKPDNPDDPSQNAAEGEEQNEIFEQRSCYIYIKISLSEPINPPLDSSILPKASEIAKNAVKNIPKNFPNVEDAVKDFRNSIYGIVQEISLEYTRMFQGEDEASGNANHGNPIAITSQTSLKSHMNTQMKELREQRREKFLIEFNSSQTFSHYRQKLKKAIFRLAVEKYNKQVDHKGLPTKQQKEVFKAELYTFIQEQMQFFLNMAVEQSINSKEHLMHQDLIVSHKVLQDAKKKKIDRNFKESDLDKFKRLSLEYDLLTDSEHAEWYIQNILSFEQENNKQDPKKWFEYAQFCLKYDKQSQAELFMNKYVDIVGLDQKLNLIMGSLYLQNKQYSKSHKYLHSVLEDDWQHIQANILMGFLYEAINRPGLQRKHFAIAKVKKMRDLNQLQPKNNAPKNFRTQSIEYMVEIIDYKNVITMDQQIKPADNDSIYFDLIDLLLDNNLFRAADIALGYIQDIHSNQYLVTKARIRTMQGQYLEATQALDEMLPKSQENIQAWIMRGHAFFLHGNLFDSEESYIKALRLNPQLKDPVLQERLGIVYAKRKAWKDAKTVFLKCCKERVSTTSWIYLGLSLLRLGELAPAEDAIAQANILDNTNPNVWALMTILCLSTGIQRLTQANLSFKESVNLGLKDKQFVEEIGDLYYNLGELDQALVAYQMLSVIAPKHPEGLKKYAEVLKDPKCRNQNIDLAIDIYKRTLKLIDGDANKTQIARNMETLLKKMGRDHEIREILQYLDQDKASGQQSEDEDNDDDGSLF